MECVCAIAVVGLISAMLLPLVNSALSSFKASQSLRDKAAEASYNNATQKTSDSNKNKTTFYVTIDYGTGVPKESAFVFTRSESSTDSDYNTQVTYYDLKYGMEGVQAPRS